MMFLVLVNFGAKIENKWELKKLKELKGVKGGFFCFFYRFTFLPFYFSLYLCIDYERICNIRG